MRSLCAELLNALNVWHGQLNLVEEDDRPNDGFALRKQPEALWVVSRIADDVLKKTTVRGKGFYLRRR